MPTVPRSFWCLRRRGFDWHRRSHSFLYSTLSKWTPALAPAATTATPEGLHVPSLGATFPYRWLRDACTCPSCVHPSTQQKLHRSSDVPASISPVIVETTTDGVHISWSGAKKHRSFFPLSFLATHANPAALRSFHWDVQPALWSTASALVAISDMHLNVHYGDLGTPRGLLRAITQLQRTGLLFVHGVPHTETSDAGCELRRLVAHFAELRETFYGATWDVKDVIDSRNIAYTSLFLGLHMDLQCVFSPDTRLASPSDRERAHTHTGTSSRLHVFRSYIACATAYMEEPPSSSMPLQQPPPYALRTPRTSRVSWRRPCHFSTSTTHGIYTMHTRPSRWAMLPPRMTENRISPR